MRALKVLAMVAAIMGGGYLSVAGAPASAEPLNVASPLAAQAQWARYYYGGYRRHHRRVYRRHYRRAYYGGAYYRPYYRPVRYVHRPRVVCRWRATAYGPRRVCVRRW